MGRSGRARFYRVASKNLKWGLVETPPDPFGKNTIFVDSAWEQKVQSRSHRSVSGNTLGPKTLWGRPAMTRTAQGWQF